MRAAEPVSKRSSLEAPAAVPPGFAELVQAFVVHLQSRGMSASTVRIRLQAMSALGRYWAKQGLEDVRQLGRTEVDGYVKWLREQALAPRTVESMISGTKAFFRFLVDTNRLLINPAEHVLERNLQHLVGPTITAKEAERLLAAPNTSLPIGIRDRAMLELFYGTGIRRAELASLTVFDVDLAGGLVRVQGKGGRERVVPLGRQATTWLRTYVEKVRPELGKHVHGRDGEHTLFLDVTGKRMSPAAISQAVETRGQAVGVRVSCHTLRRTMATEMLKRGADLPSIAKILGHANIKTTEAYTKVVPADLQRVHARLHPRGGKR